MLISGLYVVRVSVCDLGSELGHGSIGFVETRSVMAMLGSILYRASNLLTRSLLDLVGGAELDIVKWACLGLMCVVATTISILVLPSVVKGKKRKKATRVIGA